MIFSVNRVMPMMLSVIRFSTVAAFSTASSSSRFSISSRLRWRRSWRNSCSTASALLQRPGAVVGGEEVARRSDAGVDGAHDKVGTDAADHGAQLADLVVKVTPALLRTLPLLHATVLTADATPFARVHEVASTW